MRTLFFGGGVCWDRAIFSAAMAIDQARAGRVLEFLPGHDRRSAILRVTGEKGAAFFKQSFELKIKGDLIPEAAAEENMEIDKVVPVAASVKTKLGRGGTGEE